MLSQTRKAVLHISLFTNILKLMPKQSSPTHLLYVIETDFLTIRTSKHGLYKIIHQFMPRLADQHDWVHLDNCYSKVATRFFAHMMQILSFIVNIKRRGRILKPIKFSSG